jgi:uncharacterized protein
VNSETSPTEARQAHSIGDRPALRSIYRPPSDGAIAKSIDHIDDGARSFIERSPLAVIASSDGERNDASPRGGPAGFVQIINPNTLAFGDLVGNNRLDTYSNLMEHPALGILFLIPGVVETLRVNGRAALSTDPELLARCAISDKPPNVVVRVTVDECFLHCGAALRRAAVWDTTTWPARTERPSAGAILAAHIGDDTPAAVIDAGLTVYYNNYIWNSGGEPK